MFDKTYPPSSKKSEDHLSKSQVDFVKKLKKAKGQLNLAHEEKRAAKNIILNEIKTSPIQQGRDVVSVHFEKHLREAKSDIALTAEEKSATEKTLRDVVNSSSAKTRPLNSAYKKLTQSIEDIGESGSAQQGIFSNSLSRIMAVLLLAIMSTTGLAYGASSAVPGDNLYAVKTSINEPIKTMLASSPEDKADIAVRKIETRLIEAEELAKQTGLTNENTETLLDNMEKHEQELNDARKTARTVEAKVAIMEAHGSLQKALNTRKNNLSEVQNPEDLRTAYLKSDSSVGYKTEARKKKWKKAINERNLMRIRYHTSIYEQRNGLAKLSITQDIIANHPEETEYKTGKLQAVLERVANKHRNMVASYENMMQTREYLRTQGTEAEESGDYEKQMILVQNAEEQLTAEDAELMANMAEWEKYKNVAKTIKQYTQEAENRLNAGNYAQAAEKLEYASQDALSGLKQVCGEMAVSLKTESPRC